MLKPVHIHFKGQEKLAIEKKLDAFAEKRQTVHQIFENPDALDELASIAREAIGNLRLEDVQKAIRFEEPGYVLITGIEDSFSMKEGKLEERSIDTPPARKELLLYGIQMLTGCSNVMERSFLNCSIFDDRIVKPGLSDTDTHRDGQDVLALVGLQDEAVCPTVIVDKKLLLEDLKTLPAKYRNELSLPQFHYNNLRKAGVKYNLSFALLNDEGTDLNQAVMYYDGIGFNEVANCIAPPGLATEAKEAFDKIFFKHCYSVKLGNDGLLIFNDRQLHHCKAYGSGLRHYDSDKIQNRIVSRYSADNNSTLEI